MLPNNIITGKANLKTSKKKVRHFDYNFEGDFYLYMTKYAEWTTFKDFLAPYGNYIFQGSNKDI